VDPRRAFAWEIPLPRSRFPFNVPNTLTALRILLTPLFVILLIRHRYGYGLLVFSAACLSDALDGAIARIFDQRTVLGAFLDPIADKVMITCAYISLTFLGILPSWLAVIVISRDVLICAGIVIYGIFNIPFEIRPSRISKLTTFMQVSTVLVILAGPAPGAMPGLKAVAFWATAAFTIASGLHYLYVGMGLLQDALDHEARR
jgi:cardiolipin synthase